MWDKTVGAFARAVAASRSPFQVGATCCVAGSLSTPAQVASTISSTVSIELPIRICVVVDVVVDVAVDLAVAVAGHSGHSDRSVSPSLPTLNAYESYLSRQVEL